MTSLSNVFRSQNTVTEEGETRQIGIRNLNAKQELMWTKNFLLKQSLLERDRILNEAYRKIDVEKLTY